MSRILASIPLVTDKNEGTLKKAHDYITQHQDSIINQMHRNQFHLMPEVGWMNDPNGFSVFNNEYHMFYQYYPYDIQWGPMHWGHAVSEDLIKWRYLPVALAPDQSYDKSGCFSGSAIQVEDQHVLMYTGHVDPKMSFNGSLASDTEEVRQVQCLAIGDGVTYTKVAQNPVIGTEDIPENSSLSDFRDPKIWQKDNLFYCVVGSRDEDESGKILLYQSENLVNWIYIGILDHSKHELGRMWECPDIFELDGHDVLIMSPQQLHEDEFKYKNGNTTVYFIGTLDYETAAFEKVTFDEIDYGLDFYAPQTTLAPDGRRIMMAWMQSWDRNIPSDQYGWTSSMTLPRELKVINHKVYQMPIKEIENYRRNYVSYKVENLKEATSFAGISGRCIEINLNIDLKEAQMFTIKAMKGLDEETMISFDVKESVLTFDRRQSGSGIDQNKPLNIRRMKVEAEDNKLDLRLFIDTYSIELFVNNGEYAMSSTVYSKLESEGIEFEADCEVDIKIEKWDLKMNEII